MKISKHLKLFKNKFVTISLKDRGDVCGVLRKYDGDHMLIESVQVEHIPPHARTYNPISGEQETRNKHSGMTLIQMEDINRVQSNSVHDVDIIGSPFAVPPTPTEIFEEDET